MRTQVVLKNDYVSFKTYTLYDSNIYCFDIFFSCFALFRMFVSKNKKEIIELRYNCKEEKIMHCDAIEDSYIINFLPYFIYIAKKKYSLEHGL